MQREFIKQGVLFVMEDANTIGSEISKEGFRKANPEIPELSGESYTLNAWSMLVVACSFTKRIGASENITESGQRLVNFFNQDCVIRKHYAEIWLLAQDTLISEDLRLWMDAYEATRPYELMATPPQTVTKKEAETEGADFLEPIK